jgi:polyphosphate glucokinase
VDVGGSRVKLLVNGHGERRGFASGMTLTAEQMVSGVIEHTQDLRFEVVTVGVPAPVAKGRVTQEPVNVGKGWAGFDFETAFGKPTKVINDAAMQALGSYDGGTMLFLGLGTGLGTAMVVENVAQPMELAHLPYKDGRTFEEYLGEAALEAMGQGTWQKEVAAVVARLQAALEPDYVVLGGGNVRLLDELPPGCRRGDNRNAFAGGFRLWGDDAVEV